MHIYAIEGPQGVKVGVSVNPTLRIRNIETQGGFLVSRAWVSLPTRNAFSVERATHSALSATRSVGEWFFTPFDDAVSAVELSMSIEPANWREAARFEAFQRGVSLKQIADAMGVTPGAVGHWLSGRRIASVEEAQAIARAIGVRLSDLLFE